MVDNERVIEFLMKKLHMNKSKPPLCRQPNQQVEMTCYKVMISHRLPNPGSCADIRLLETESWALWWWQSVLPLSFICVWCKLPSV